MIKLLLVEDDVNLSYIVQTALEDLIGGYQVFTAPNGAEGLKQWEAHRPDIIVSDIDMPVMNGFDMVRRIRETDKTTPIIFGSALTSPRDEGGLQAGREQLREEALRARRTGRPRPRPAEADRRP